jgi:fructokinase
MSEEQKLYGGIEAGGSKFVCAIGDMRAKIWEKVVIPTTIPQETMPRVIDFFRRAHIHTPLSGIGIASFGPLDPDPRSQTYGYITTTPKAGWEHFDFVGTMKKAFNLPIAFDTDVNGAAIAEHHWGAAQDLHTFLYITIGTGIGGGGMFEGKMMHGLMHPEMGHILIPHNKERDPFDGVCPFHGDCFEGLASGPAMKKRWKVDSAMDLPEDHVAWTLEADYLAMVFANYIMTLSPQRLIIGGGVMRQKHLLDKVRPRVLAYLNGYVKHDEILKKIDEYIVSPQLGEQSGICGAIAMADVAANNS